jgi:hypothetical protein
VKSLWYRSCSSMKSFVLLESFDDTRGRKRFSQGKLDNTNPFSVFTCSWIKASVRIRFQKYERKRNSMHRVFCINICSKLWVVLYIHGSTSPIGSSKSHYHSRWWCSETLWISRLWLMTVLILVIFFQILAGIDRMT